MTIYERIKEMRENLGLSQQELAERVGYKTASAVNKIELGLRDLNQSKIIAFAAALNVSPGYLMGDVEISPDDELTEYLEELRTRSEMRMLFSVAKGATKEDVEKVVEMFKIIKGEYNG